MIFGLEELSKELDKVEETGVSFCDKSQKWEDENNVQDLIAEIEKCPKLMYLNLAGNTLGIDAAKVIGRALEKHPEFQKALWSDLFTGRLKTEIPQALKHLGNGIATAGAHLTVLDCSDNALGPNGMVGLEGLIRSPSCYSLKELKLKNCGLGIEGGKMLAKALLDCHTKSTGAGTPLELKVFIAGRNRLENDGTKALAKVFATIKTLEQIEMPQNGIYYDGFSALSEAFKENVNMRVLNFNDNTIKAKGAAALADVLEFMPKLKEINFGDCLLKTRGAELIADALRDDHMELEIIDLSANEIGPEGGRAVIEALQNKPNLQSVILNSNEFGSDGCDTVRDLMNDTANPSALGSLSDDESGDEEEEQDDDEDDEENDEEHDASTEAEDDDYEGGDTEEDVEEGNYVTALNNASLNTTVENSFSLNNSSVYFNGEEARPNNVETFCSTPNPSLKLFNSLEESDKLEAFRSYIKNFKDDDYLLFLVFTVLKCAALSKDSNEALQIAESLLVDAFTHATETNQITRVKNFFLIQLGLLKCEDKTFKPSFNLSACRHAVQHCVSKQDSPLPEDVKNTFKLFLERLA